MATKLASRPGLYASDFYVWAEEQAALLRARRFDALDLDHLIEEAEGWPTPNAARFSTVRAWSWSIC